MLDFASDVPGFEDVSPDRLIDRWEAARRAAEDAGDLDGELGQVAVDAEMAAHDALTRAGYGTPFGSGSRSGYRRGDLLYLPLPPLADVDLGSGVTTIIVVADRPAA